MSKQEVAITRKGQVTIPAEVRRALGLKARDKVIFELCAEEGVARLRPAPSKVGRWFGVVAPKERPEDFRKVREEFEDAVAGEVAGEAA